MKTIYTIGYEGRNISEFINLLKKNNIKLVIDVRRNPVSRKTGFSKNQFRKHLIKEGINYISKIELGVPNSLRNKLKEDKDYNYFFNQYKEYLKFNLTGHIALQNLQEILKGNEILLCYEKDYTKCHRKIIAEQIKGFKIVHI